MTRCGSPVVGGTEESLNLCLFFLMFSMESFPRGRHEINSVALGNVSSCVPDWHKALLNGGAAWRSFVFVRLAPSPLSDGSACKSPINKLLMGIEGDLLFSTFCCLYLPVLPPNCANNRTGRHLCRRLKGL